MPTYEYVCDACEHAFEEFQGITAKPLKKCPECGKSKLRRLIGTGAGIIFKGSGFYQTDYRSDSYNKDKKADSSSSTASDSAKAETTTDAKTQTKAEPKPTADKPKAEKKPKKD